MDDDLPSMTPLDEPEQRPTPPAAQQPSVSPTPQPTPAPQAAPRGPGWIAVVAVAALTAGIVGLIAGLGGYAIGQRVDRSAGGSLSTVTLPQATVAPGSTAATSSVGAIVDAVLPSVVSILAEGSVESGSGSGFVLRSDGYLLTNNHVVSLVDDKGTLTVIFNDGTKVPGKVVGVNASYDLAVVKVDRDNLPAVVLGDSKAVHVGDQAVAIGAPLGLDGTVTSGIISALDRPVTAGGVEDQSFINAIQTDAAINPGNSGGPLLDGAGRVIGINSAIASLGLQGEAGSIGLGFAIPVNDAKRIAEELIATGSSKTPAIGVSLDTAFTGEGARIGEINSGGPAEEAGLRAGDVIIALDGRSVADSTELVVAIRSHSPGDEVEVEYLRDDQAERTVVTLGELPSGN